VGAGLLPNEHRKPQRHGQTCLVHVKLWLVSEAFRIQYEIGKGPRGIGSSRAFFHVVPVYHNAGSEQLPRPFLRVDGSETCVEPLTARPQSRRSSFETTIDEERLLPRRHVDDENRRYVAST
jgi:hypothetical protein